MPDDGDGRRVAHAESDLLVLRGSDGWRGEQHGERKDRRTTNGHINHSFLKTCSIINSRTVASAWRVPGRVPFFAAVVSVLNDTTYAVCDGRWRYRCEMKPFWSPLCPINSTLPCRSMKNESPAYES